MKKIALHTAPRSGSSWLGQIFNSSPNVNYKFQPLFSYAFKDYLDERSSKADIDKFFELIANSDDDFLLQKDKIAQGIYPEFQKNSPYTHAVYKEVRYHHILNNMMKVDNNIKVVGLVRNPFAVIHSFLQSPREFRRDLGWIPEDEWRHAPSKNQGRKEEYYGYEKWKELLNIYRDLQAMWPKRFYLAKYDDLLADTFGEVSRIFEFSELEIGDQTRDFIKNSRIYHDDDVYSVYKEKLYDDGWVSKLDPEIVSSIQEDLANSSLHEFL